MRTDAHRSAISDCPTQELSAYIDGELDPATQVMMENHLLTCDDCFAELNYQKEFLNQLSLSMKQQGEIDLPPNFAETVVAKAESSVSGLRKPTERFNAVFVCAGLVLLVIFALSFDSEKLLPDSADVFEKMAALAGFVFQLIYSFVIGFGALLRAVGGSVTVPGSISFLIIGVFVIVFLIFTRTLLRSRRT